MTRRDMNIDDLKTWLEELAGGEMTDDEFGELRIRIEKLGWIERDQSGLWYEVQDENGEHWDDDRWLRMLNEIVK